LPRAASTPVNVPAAKMGQKGRNIVGRDILQRRLPEINAGTLAATGMPTVSGNTFNADNELTAFNRTTLAYDANGNLLSDGTNTYIWDARNHTSAIIGGTSFFGFNCCHCAEQAMKACGVNPPASDWPNWPINPGPQPGEPGAGPGSVHRST